MFDDNGASDTADQIQEQQQQQIDEQNSEIETKRQSLFTQRLDIIKSQNSQDWNSPKNTQPQGTLQGKQ